jgi:hypothetical protein
MLEEDGILSLRELSGKLNASLERVHHIVTVKSGMTKVCTKRVLCELSVLHMTEVPVDIGDYLQNTLLCSPDLTPHDFFGAFPMLEHELRPDIQH